MMENCLQSLECSTAAHSAIVGELEGLLLLLPLIACQHCLHALVQEVEKPASDILFSEGATWSETDVDVVCTF